MGERAPREGWGSRTEGRRPRAGGPRAEACRRRVRARLAAGECGGWVTAEGVGDGEEGSACRGCVRGSVSRER